MSSVANAIRQIPTVFASCRERPDAFSSRTKLPSKGCDIDQQKQALDAQSDARRALTGLAGGGSPDRYPPRTYDLTVTKWERFSDDTWINVDHVEVMRVEEQEDGRWILSAAFSSGRTHPLGSSDDRELLAECTDVVLRGGASDVAKAAAEKEPEVSATMTAEPRVEPERPVPKRGWRFWRPASQGTPGVPEGRAEAGPLPVS